MTDYIPPLISPLTKTGFTFSSNFDYPYAMKSKKPSRQTVFLDRDGVINQDSPDYIKRPDEFEFIPGSLEAIKRFTENGLDVIVITNQSVINRKMVSKEELDLIFSKMVKGVLANGGHIKDIFYCPHAPEDDCDCRKPNPGLIFKARKKYDIDLAESVMVGDSVKDMACARHAGVGKSVLVKTGNGIGALQTLLAQNTPPDHVAEDLNDAATWIINQLTFSSFK